MSKFVGTIVGGAEIAAGVLTGIATGWTGVGLVAAEYLIAAGAGTLIAGIGTLLASSGQFASITAQKDPIAPWEINYGRTCHGGVPVYINSWGDNDKYLDMVFVVAAHSCKGIYGLRFDGQRVQIDTTAVPPGVPASSYPVINGGTSFTPLQQKIPIAALTRVNGVVTVQLNANIPLLMVGDYVNITGVTDPFGNPLNVNGRWQVSEIVSQTFSPSPPSSPPDPGSVAFQYLCGGVQTDIEANVSNAYCQTLWVDYGRKIYMEVMTGKQTLGETFFGQLEGTPADGDTDNLINPSPNPWNANCSGQGKTAVFLRLHYNDVYFSNGLPQISFLIYGKDDIYDPRPSPPTYGYTENSALCTADFLAQGATNLGSSPPVVGIPRWGYGAVYGTEIPIPPLISAANICDEQVGLAVTITELDYSSFQTEPRYTCNGHFPLTMKRGEILQNMLTSMAGRITYENGQFILWPAAWQGGGISNVPTGRGNGALMGCFTAGAIPETAVMSTMFIGNGPATFTAPPGTNYLQMGINGGLFGQGSYLVNVAINGVSQGDFTVTSNSICWNWAFNSNAPFQVSVNGSIPIESTFGFDQPQYVACNAGDLVTITYLSGLVSAQQLAPFTDANGDPADIIGLGAPFPPSHWTITYYEGTTFELPSPLPVLGGPFKWIPKRSYRDLYNGVKGKFVSQANNWQAADFPPYCQDGLHGYTWSTAEFENDSNLEADGGARLWKDIQLPFTISYATAQRIAKIELLRNRMQGTGTFRFNMWGYQLTALDIIEMTLPFLGWTNKLLEVQKHRFLLNERQDSDIKVIDLATEIDVQETELTMYDWDPYTEQLTLQGYQQSVPASTTPNAAPTFMSAYMATGPRNAVVGTDGVSRAAIQLNWPAPTDGWMTNGGHIELQYQVCAELLQEIYNGAAADPMYSSPPADSTWILLPNASPFVSSYKTDIELDENNWYRFQVRFVNAAGVPSSWVDIYNPLLSSPPNDVVIAIQPSAAPTQVTPAESVAFNGSL